MTRLSRIQRVVLLAASTTAITGGVLLPTSAFAAPATPPAGTTADAAARWTQTTDDPSGISARLPGKAEMRDVSEHGVEGRMYVAKTDYGAIGFAVYDTPPGGRWDLKGCLQDTLNGFNEDSRSADGKLTSKDVQEGTTPDGQPALDAALAARDGTVGHVRYVDLGDHMIMVISLGTSDNRQAMDADYLQLLNGIQLPGNGTVQSL